MCSHIMEVEEVKRGDGGRLKIRRTEPIRRKWGWEKGVGIRVLGDLVAKASSPRLLRL